MERIFFRVHFKKLIGEAATTVLLSLSEALITNTPHVELEPELSMRVDKAVHGRWEEAIRNIPKNAHHINCRFLSLLGMAGLGEDNFGYILERLQEVEALIPGMSKQHRRWPPKMLTSVFKRYNSILASIRSKL